MRDEERRLKVGFTTSASVPTRPSLAGLESERWSQSGEHRNNNA
jgi:hypothetical protein